MSKAVEKNKKEEVKKATKDVKITTKVENAYTIITRPIVNEKTTQMNEQGKMVFLVAPKATKTQIKKAAESLFEVKVKVVHTINQQGKRKRFRGIFGKRKNYKKAIITLEKGENTELLMGAKA